MRVINHNWSATKQHLHLQSVAEISRHSVLSGTGFDNVRHRLGSLPTVYGSSCTTGVKKRGLPIDVKTLMFNRDKEKISV